MSGFRPYPGSSLRDAQLQEASYNCIVAIQNLTEKERAHVLAHVENAYGKIDDYVAIRKQDVELLLTALDHDDVVNWGSGSTFDKIAAIVGFEPASSTSLHNHSHDDK